MTELTTRADPLRLLTIMGSGETAPTMVKVHRAVLERLGSSASPIGVIFDTPFGFQTNAAEIGARAQVYFRESVGATLEVAGIRRASDLVGESGDRILGRIAEVPLLFAGPGSPSYALRQWRDTLVPSLIAEKLALGGAVTFASAAALTLGARTVPVYEIYKVGEDPHWLEGLDLLRPLGLPAVVIPHYDNAEGQTHDTRYCYLGEERLSSMESELEDETFVLGVDEHTAVCIDLSDSKATVLGRGTLTVRVRGRSATIGAGASFELTRLVDMARELASARITNLRARSDAPRDGAYAGDTTSQEESPVTAQGSPLLQSVRQREVEFRAARDASDARAMVSAVLALEEEMWAWRADTLQSDEMDRARASLRSMITDLGRLCELGVRDPATVLAPYLDLALELRESSRREGRYAEADAVRERLELLGVSVRDTPEGPSWEMLGGKSRN